MICIGIQRSGPNFLPDGNGKSQSAKHMDEVTECRPTYKLTGDFSDDESDAVHVLSIVIVVGGSVEESMSCSLNPGDSNIT